MPELPEVEAVRRSVEPLILGRRVLGALLLRRDVLVAPGDPYGGFSRQRGRSRRDPAPLQKLDLLSGLTISELRRHGKQLAIVAIGPAGPRALGVQLGMTGGLRFVPAGSRDQIAAHVHATWTFKRGVLEFADPRRFGGLRVFRSDQALNEHFAELGPDALTISEEQLAAALAGSGRAVKAALLDQGVLAGVGNIYADEALFHARIAPTARAGRLKPDAVHRLAAAVRAVLTRAVAAGGSTLRDFADATGTLGRYQQEHAVYGRGGQPCRRCGKPLVSDVLAQRSTVWCRRCQPQREPA